MFFTRSVLPTRFQQALDDYISPRYGQKRGLGPKNDQIPKYGYLDPDPPKMKKIKNNVFHQKRLLNTLPTSPQWLWDHISTTYGQKRVLGPKNVAMPKYGNLGPVPRKMRKIKHNVFHQKHLTNTLPTCPQWLSDDHFSPRYGQKRVLGPKNVQIPKYGYLGPEPRKITKIWNNIFHQKRLSNTLPTSPQPLSDDHFSPR